MRLYSLQCPFVCLFIINFQKSSCLAHAEGVALNTWFNKNVKFPCTYVSLQEIYGGGGEGGCGKASPRTGNNLSTYSAATFIPA
jgi:hypothetical protein